ncbi:guanylate kinase [Patescibacteria group bacterium]|nr:guanylate kinase [Patescibacteria group bacterium]MBU1703088.1 guanylate kinase [Patescibacteria group bacterium]MBU1954264.1 guanylate kinase [Patescibacteria group bacterium]
MDKNLTGLLFIICGPSGVGKGTVIRHLKKKYPWFKYPISHTTREIRPGEKDGEVYHFISREEFEKGIKEGKFLEWARVHETNYYGTLKKPIIEALKAGEVIVREVDVQGAHSMKKVVPAKNLVTIFLKAESKEKLLSRIAKRGELPQAEIRRRMRSAEREMDQADDFNYQVWNLQDQIRKCVGDVKKIIEAELKKAGLSA